MRIWLNARTVLHDHWRTYLLLNLAVYGVLAASAVMTLLLPGLRGRAAQDVETFGGLPILSVVTEAYTDGDVLAAAVGTFLANLLFAAVLTTTLPSLLIPYLGVVLTVLRTGMIGVWLTPTTPGEAIALLPHLIVLVIEMQAYVLTALGTVVLWRTTFGHRRLELPSAGAGYRAGVADMLRLYPVIAALLLVIAIVEAIEVIWIMPLLG